MGMQTGRAALVATVAAVLMLLCALALTLSTADRTVEKTEMMSDFAKKRLREAVKEAGKAPSPQERSKTMHMLMPIANHVATRLLYTEVAERARANPKAPGHQAMEHVLNSKKELSEIESSVKNKLVNIHSGAWAQEIYRKTPAKMHKLLPALATQAAHTATMNAFQTLKKQMILAEKNPNFMKHLPATDPNA